MKNSTLIIIALVVALIGFIVVWHSDIDLRKPVFGIPKVQNTPANNASESKATDVQIDFEDSENNVDPTVLVGGETRLVFPGESDVMVRGGYVSPSGNFVYVGRAGEGDAVLPHVYDVKTGETHPVGIETFVENPTENPEELAEPEALVLAAEGFATVLWLENDTLQIEYDETLAPAEGEEASADAVGYRLYSSVSAQTPWIVR